MQTNGNNIYSKLTSTAIYNKGTMSFPLQIKRAIKRDYISK